MRFCPRCGSLMTLQRDGDKRVWVCPRCGYREEVSGAATEAQQLVLRHKIRHSEKDRIVVVQKDANWESMPKTRVTCPKCGYNEAYYWLVQTRKSDEPPTRFFKCVRCGYVWREYD